MKTEISPQVRSLVSGLAAFAAMSLLMTSLVESSGSGPRQINAGLSTPPVPHVAFLTAEK